LKNSILFTDAVIHTGKSEADTASSMLVKNGRIVSLDDSDCGDSEKISLNGRHVYPCLIDGHMHLLQTVITSVGFTVCKIVNGTVEPHDIMGVGSLIRDFASNQPQDGIIVGTNYIMTAVEEHRLPGRAELDEWCGGRPAVIYTIDGHASSLSSAMLEKLGINPAEHSGVLTGEEHEHIQGRLTDVISASVTAKTLAKGVANFHNACALFGISCVGALEGNGDSPKDPTTILILRLARHFSVAVKAYYQYTDVKRAVSLTKYQKRPRIGGCGDWEMDGACGAHSAAFSVPYRDTGVIAPTYFDQKFVDKLVSESNDAGFQISSHAIGDAAIERIAAALEKITPKCRHRIEHFEFASDKSIESAAENGWAVMLQPGYSWVDKRYLHTYERYLPDKIISQLKLRTMLEKGVLVCGSSDSPVQELDPWLQMMGMTQFYNEDESISAWEAFRCYTSNAAKAILEEDERGMLLPGMLADFFISDKNIFTMKPEELGSFRPKKTYYGGVPAKHWKGTLPEFISMLLTVPHKI
jgi:predicted amidohydrolase YtcJ